MLISQRDVRQMISQFCADFTRNTQIRVEASALSILTDVPSGFISHGFIDVDPEELQRAVFALLRYAARNTRIVTASSIQSAMQTGNCHYLWLC